MAEMLKEYQEILNPYVLYWEDNIIYHSTDTSIKIGKSEVFEDFKAWCMKNNHTNLAKVSTRKFWYDMSMLMEQLKLPPLQYKKTQGKRFVVGIELKRKSESRLKKSFLDKIADLDDDIEGLSDDEEKEVALSPSSTKKKKKVQTQSATKNGQTRPIKEEK